MKRKISVIGLGYVGLPVAVAFGNNSNVIGFDVNEKRLAELRKGHDCTREIEARDLKAANIHFTSNPEDLRQADFHIVAVPTPINEAKQPNLTPLLSATETVGNILKPGDIVVYESTVYPGCTEEECVPILENQSGLTYINKSSCNVSPLVAEKEIISGFFVGYSPERINPGDIEHNFTNIKKIISGSTPETLEILAETYSSVVKVGVHKTSSIKVAEAAKIIENTQRDVNIALINELALIFNKLNIDTEEVLKAAGTKWNFLPFKPGLVGGHCIGVDPYYLTHKAIEVSYNPEMILAGRRLNDSMGYYVADQVTKLMTKKRIHVVDANILIMGLTFKENCPDLRNTKIIDLVREFQSYNCNVDIYDPWVDKNEALEEYGITPIDEPKTGTYGAIILAVAHDEFKVLGAGEIRNYGKKKHVLYDIKYLLEANDVDGRL
jgi:UDP-N-acetyl-D-glucosamine/UDP-N-acetyl-D-galactosamine dehydrogenase